MKLNRFDLNYPMPDPDDPQYDGGEQEGNRAMFFMKHCGNYVMPDVKYNYNMATEHLLEMKKWGNQNLRIIERLYKNTLQVKDNCEDFRALHENHYSWVSANHLGVIISDHNNYSSFFEEFKTRLVTQELIVQRAMEPAE